jgi:tellurium resistance protein TerD
MAINLQKGQNVSLNAESPGINHLLAGLGWDTQSFAGAAFDLDVMVFLTDGSDKVISDNHFVFYNNLKSPDGSVEHTGDNLTGDGDGDDESILVSLANVEARVEKVIFTASSAGRPSGRCATPTSASSIRPMVKKSSVTT